MSSKRTGGYDYKYPHKIAVCLSEEENEMLETYRRCLMASLKNYLGIDIELTKSGAMRAMITKNWNDFEKEPTGDNHD